MVFRCRMCSRNLVEGASTERCSYCGRQEPADWRCPEGHYICETCRTSDAEALIERTCLASDRKDPRDLAELILKHGVLPTYGAAHHILAAPVLLAAMRNRRVPGLGDASIRQAIARLRDIPGSVCATRGDCGAAASAGVVVSILREATPLSDAERSAALRATAATLVRIADQGGPRCCRQSVFVAIQTTWDLLREELGLEPLPARPCSGAGTLKDCKTTRCGYYG